MIVSTCAKRHGEPRSLTAKESMDVLRAATLDALLAIAG